jgi:hypothetical protein
MSSSTQNELFGAEALKYAEANLRQIRAFPDRWETEYEDPRTKEKWILDYPHSERHGGGEPRLRKVQQS